MDEAGQYRSAPLKALAGASGVKTGRVSQTAASLGLRQELRQLRESSLAPRKL